MPANTQEKKYSAFLTAGVIELATRMTINVLVLSHAFLTEKGSVTPCTCNVCGGVLNGKPSYRQMDMKIDNNTHECMKSQDTMHLPAISQIQQAGCCTCTEFMLSPRSTRAGSPSPRTTIGASQSPRLLEGANPSPRTGCSKSRKKSHKKRGGRKRAQDWSCESKEPKIMQIEERTVESGSRDSAQAGSCISCKNKRSSGDNMQVKPCVDRHGGDGCCSSEGSGMHSLGGQGDGLSHESVEAQHVEVDVTLREVREECSSALGIVKEDLELFGLFHIPSSAERVTLLKNMSGIMHLGVMVRNSDLNLERIEELVLQNDKAEQEAESCHLQLSEKTQDFSNLKLKYEKLTDEVLRLRTMVNRANHMRRESEKATEVLRVEFEKLVKTLFAECSHEVEDKTEFGNE